MLHSMDIVHHLHAMVPHNHIHRGIGISARVENEGASTRKDSGSSVSQPCFGNHGPTECISHGSSPDPSNQESVKIDNELSRIAEDRESRARRWPKYQHGLTLI
ncbi:uncharacterized protein LOC143175142 [Nomia melanderi]|uniref:uncharacterized protein LOC143175142 n=1 Tax=Nomia melanderi TaxID=2448451 RepID=UPI003FCDB21A